MPRELRDYQREAVDAVVEAWGQDDRKVAVVMATGLGKSTVIAQLAVTAAHMGLRVVLLAHRGELLNQMSATILDIDANLSVGRVQADENDVEHQIVAASFQTITRPRRREQLGARDVILVDEVHHLPAKTYLEAVRELGGDRGAFLCGFTATLARSDGGLGGLIDRVVYEKDIKWGIEQGYLIAPRGLTVHIPDLDLSSIRTVAGDFHQAQLAEQMEASSGYVADAVVKHASDRRMIVFAASVAATYSLVDALNAAGITAGVITGESGTDEREQSYEAFKAGRMQALVTVQVLTEGVDLPMCDCIVIARPTQSRILFTQMVGRALRPFEGKEDALVLDLAGTTRVLKIVRLVDLTPYAEHRELDEDGAEIIPEDEIESDEPGDRPVRAIRMGPVDMTPVGLFDDGGTEVLWLRSTEGISFLPGHDTIIAIREWNGSWHVAEISTRGVRHVNRISSEAENVIDAVAIAERYATNNWDMLPYKSASWRKRGGPPSEAQLRFARTLGIPDTEGMNKARLSDEISIRVADRALRAPARARA